jgi:nucleoside-diphosphate-sugar epimerase
MKDLVLGGEGLIGASLVRSLRAAGNDAHSLDLRSGCDLRSSLPVPLTDYDRVWFLAWDTGGAKYIESAQEQHQIYSNNCAICLRVFDALARAKRPFLFASSQLAGQPNAYGLTKLLAETWTRQLGGVVARMWNVYGWESPGIRSHVVTDLVLSALQGGEIRLRTTGKERRRLLYKQDCAEALILLFGGGLVEGDIAGPEWLTVLDLAREIAALLDVPVHPGSGTAQEVMIDPGEPPPGWRPRTPLREGLQQVIEEARAFLTREGAGR